MKTRDTIILLVVVVVVGLFIFIYERNLPSTGEIKEREGRILSRFDPTEVTRITLVSGTTHIVLERVGETEEWKLTSPVEAEAEGAVVDGLLSDLEFLTFERKVEGATGEQRKSFGLVDPSLEAEISQGDDVTRFVLGSEAEAGGVYLALDGHDLVYVVDPMSIESLRRGSGEFRQKRLLGREGGAVGRIRMRSGAGSDVLLEEKGGRWTVTTGGGAPERASRRAADRVVAALEGLKVLRYLEDGVVEKDIGAKGFEEESPRVEFDRAQGEGGTLVFGGACEEVDEEAAVRAVLLPAGTLVCVGQAARDTILTPTRDMRLTSPAEVDAYEVFSLEARRGGDVRVRLEKDDEGEWLITAPGEKRPAQKDAIEELIDALSKKKADELLPLPADLTIVGLDPLVAVQIVVLDVVGEEVASLLLGRNEEGAVTFRRSGEDFYGVLGVEPVLAGAADPWNYLSRSVLRRDYFDSVRLALTGPVSHVLVKEEGGWLFESPAGLAADSADVRDTLETFSSLSALRFLSDGSPASLKRYGLVDPQWIVEVRYDDEGGEESPPVDAGDASTPLPGKPVRLLIGSEVEEGRAAYLEAQGVDAVLLLSAKVVYRLTRPLADKGALASATADVVKVSIEAGGGSEMYAVKNGKIDAFLSGKQGYFQPDAVRTFFEKLTTLRAGRGVGYGPPPPGSGLGQPVLTVKLFTGDASTEPRVITFGARFEAEAGEFFHTRFSTVDATFGVDASLLEPLL